MAIIIITVLIIHIYVVYCKEAKSKALFTCNTIFFFWYSKELI